MGINLNNDTERQYGFNSPSNRGGPGGGYHYGTGFKDTCEDFGTGFNEAPAPGGGPPRRRVSPLFRLLACLLAIAVLVFIVSRVIRPAEDIIPPSDRGTIPYSSMVYERPDTDALFSMIDAMAESGGSGSYGEITGTLDEIYSQYWSFYTMYTLADIKFSVDTTDEYYMGECLFFSENAPVLDQKMDEMFSALSRSPMAARLDRDYFGSSYLSAYSGETQYDGEYVSLLQRESELVYEYEAMISDPVIELDGETVYYLDYIDSGITNSEYTAATQAYYEKYAHDAGEIYIELVKTRQAIAERLGYSSYSDYAYASYGRDYSAREASEYIDTVADALIPVYSQLLEEGGFALYYQFGSLSEEENAAALKSACRNMGGRVWEIYQYMEDYGLYDISPSSVKYPGSFQVYLESWSAPFIFVNPTGTMTDFTSFSHEFGHFVDTYVNYNSYITVDASEACSQSMALLAPLYADTISSDGLEALCRSSMLDALSTYVEQGAYNAFEDRVYSLPENELTVENLMEISLECFTEYSMVSPGYDWYYSACWIDVPHFFLQPYYVASYIVSLDAALQIYELELTSPGEGVDTFMMLADRDWSLTYMENVTAIGLKTPFDTGRGEEAAAFILNRLNNS